MRLEKRYSQRHQYLVSYSLVKSDDNNPAGRWVDYPNTSADWGPSNAERRHSLTVSGSVLLPLDITLGTVWSLRTSLPFNVTAGRDINGDGFVSDFVPGTSRNQGHRGLDLNLVNAWRAASNLAPVTEDSIASTKFTSLDLRASKGFNLGGSRDIELVAQLFNVLNVANFSGIQTNAVATTFGQASRAAAGRQAELAVRFGW